MCDLCNGTGWMLNEDGLADYCTCPKGRDLKKGHGGKHDKPAEERHHERLPYRDADDGVPF
jgi:hypothetical protein